MAIYRRGGTYWFSFVFDGRRIQRSTKQANRKAAIEIESAYRTALAKGEVGIAPPIRERRTIGDLLDALKSNYEQNGKLTQQNRSLISRAKQSFESKLATDLTSDDISQYTTIRKKQGAQNSSVNRVLEVIRRSYKLAEIVFPKAERLSERGNARQGFLSEAELETLISHLPEYLRDFTRFAATTGTRKGELAALAWEMVQDGEIRIPGNVCKNRQGRVIPLDGELAAIIERRRAVLSRGKDGTLGLLEYIFHRNGAPICEIRKSWQRATIAVGLGVMVCRKCEDRGTERYCHKCKVARSYTGKLFHDLRRTAVRNMVQAGVSTQVAKKWSGHKSDSMFERYSILTTDDMREAAKKVKAYRAAQRGKVVAIATK